MSVWSQVVAAIIALPFVLLGAFLIRATFQRH